MKKVIRLFIQLHRWLGLILALNFLVLTISGILLLWRDEIEQQPQGFKNQQKEEMSFALNRVEQYVKDHYSDKKLLAIYWDDDHLLNARFTDRDKQVFRGATKLKFSADGELLKQQVPNSFFDTVLKLHREMLIGGTGKILIGILGIFIFLTVMLGLIVSPNFAHIRNSLNLRIKLGNFHRFIGLASASWLLLVTLTGVFLSFNSIIISLFLTSTLAHMETTAGSIHSQNDLSATQALEQVRLQLPEHQFNFISYPDNEFSLPGRYVMIMEKAQETHIVIASGVAKVAPNIIELPWYLKALLISEPLHFGNYGGWVLKLVWTMFGVLAFIIPCSGILIFLLRRRIITITHPRLGLLKRFKFNVDLKLPAMLLIPSAMILGSFYVDNLWKYFFAVCLLLFCCLIFMQLISLAGQENDL